MTKNRYKIKYRNIIKFIEFYQEDLISKEEEGNPIWKLLENIKDIGNYDIELTNIEYKDEEKRYKKSRKSY